VLTKLQKTLHEFPPRFWMLVGASFIDHVGAKMVFPFFSLYITSKFNVGMTEAGLLLGLFHISGLAGSLVGGALADRFGRKLMVLFGLVISASSAVMMGLVDQLAVFYLLAVMVGLLSDIAGPAWQAMVADILPEKKRTEGFGVMRVIDNMAWIIGPLIGGFIATRSYLLLFVIDAFASLITAALIFRLIPETKPVAASGQVQETTLQTFGGYSKVLADRLFIAFLLAAMVMTVVYLQMYGSLSVFLRDVHGVAEQGFSIVMATSAITVVLFQFWVSRQAKNYPPMLMMALGAALYMFGFSLYGFVSAFPLFLAAMVVITFGEMLVVPVSQTVAANFAPEDMRGRYMAIFGLSWAIPGAFGPLAAGLIMDNYDPNYVWYIGGVLCFISALGFLALHRAARARFAAMAVRVATPGD
jgi:MFS family permease